MTGPHNLTDLGEGTHVTIRISLWGGEPRLETARGAIVSLMAVVKLGACFEWRVSRHDNATSWVP